MGQGILEFDHDAFTRHAILGSEPTLIDFCASWCMPSLHAMRVIQRLASEFAGRVLVAAFDVDRDAHLARRYSVTSFPTMKLFVAGSVVDTFQGEPLHDEVAVSLNRQLRQLAC